MTYHDSAPSPALPPISLMKKPIQKTLGVTLVFVTHDQEEALAMSDRIAVMNLGRVEQIGTPAEIYDRPQSRFVADFIGEINVFDGRVEGERFVGGDGRALPAPTAASDRAIALAIRPEKLRAVEPGTGLLDGSIESANFLGGQALYRVATGDAKRILLKETLSTTQRVRAVGQSLALTWSAEDAVLLAR